MMTNDPNMNVYATIGYPAEGGSGIAIYEKNRPDVYMGRAGNAFGISLDHQARLQMGDYTLLLDKNGVIRLRIGDDYIYLRDKNGVVRLQIDDGTYLRDKNGVIRLWIGDDYIYLRDENGVARLRIGDDYTYLVDKNDVVRLRIDPNGNTYLRNANSHAIGVDNSGPYFTKSGAKTYLDTLTEAFVDRGVMPSGSLNQDFPMGAYMLRTSNTYTNAPADSGTLLVFKASSHIVQQFISWDSFYIRYRTSGAWSPWRDKS